MPSIIVTGTNADGIFEFDCRDTSLKSSKYAEYFGEDSKCYETDIGRPMCMKTLCDERSYKVKVVIDTHIMTCNNDGDWMEVMSENKKLRFQCPPIAVVCPE